jgi:hypothetical protein
MTSPGVARATKSFHAWIHEIEIVRLLKISTGSPETSQTWKPDEYPIRAQARLAPTSVRYPMDAVSMSSDVRLAAGGVEFENKLRKEFIYY